MQRISGEGLWDSEACQTTKGQPDQGAEEGLEGVEKPGG